MGLASQSRIDALENELAAARHEVAQLRAQLHRSERSELLQRVFEDRLVLEHLPEVVCLLDRELTIIYLSRTIPGRNVGDFLGTSAVDRIVPQYREEFLAAFERAWCSREPQVIAYGSMSERFWETRFVPIQRDGNVEYMLAASLETTERVRAEDALRQIDTRLRHAIDVVGMGTWTRDWQTGAMAWDDALCAIFGITPAEVPQSYDAALKFVHPDDAARLRAVSERGQETGALEEVEYRIVRPSGEVRYVLAKGSVQSDAQGRGYGTLGAVFDVTDRKRLEEQLYQRQKMEAVGELTSGIAHNFNNVLSIILPNLELCIEDAPRDLIERLTDAEQAALRAADLVRQLMIFARHETGASKVALDPIATLKRIASICQTTFDRSIRIELELGAAVPNVCANPGQLEQVLLNICINARDALEAMRDHSPRILLSAVRTEAGGLRMRITDNGPGMDDATRARVFEPFFTTKEVGRGTGLGLATAYAIITDHGGRITCQSRAGEGATFEIELPGVQTPLAAARPPSVRPSAAGGGETILLIDDDDLVRRAARTTLLRNGYRVLESRDGDEALALVAARRETIDLVVLDRSMPGRSGEAILSELRALAPDVRVLLLSGQPFSAESAARANAALIKPVRSEELLGKIRSLLDR